MNPNLPYLLEEICSGIEIYYTGRRGGQYLKTAYILCDDHTELTSKLFLLDGDPNWSDTRDNGRFKSYHDILQDVQDVIQDTRPVDLTTVQRLSEAMQNRRQRRNDFFHSTSLLDLSVTPRVGVESFCDLLDYGELLFGQDWRDALNATRNLDTFSTLLRLERRAFSDPSITPKVDSIIASQQCANWRWSKPKAPSGIQLVQHGEDMYLRMSIIYGGQELADRLRALL